MQIPTIDDYIDAARVRQGLTSDNQLSKRMGFLSSPISLWRVKKAWPNDEHMAELARLAGRDPRLALIALNYWRAKGAAKECYRTLFDTIAATAATALILLALSGPAMAEPLANKVTAQSSSVYIMEFIDVKKYSLSFSDSYTALVNG